MYQAIEALTPTELLNIGEVVAKELGPQYKVSVSHDNAHITDGTVEFYLSNNKWNSPDRIFVRIDTSAYRNLVWAYSDPKFEISVSASKSPSAIAKDIERRFLPGVEAYFQVLQERKAKADSATNKVVANVASICAINPILFDDDSERKEGHVCVTLTGSKDSFYGHFRANSDTFEIELRSVPPAVALKIAQLLDQEAKS